MTPLEEMFRAVEQELARRPSDLLEEEQTATGFETGLRHPVHEKSSLLLRDDGAVELRSEGGELRLNNGGATLGGAATTISGGNLHLHAPPGALWFGFQRFDPTFRWYQLPHDPVSWLWNGPLCLNGPEDLALLGGAPPMNLVAGKPEPGQWNVSLSQVMRPVPLLGRNEFFEILSRKLAEIARALVPHGL